MPIDERHHTLAIQWPFGRTLLATIFALTVLMVLSEALARDERVEPMLLPPAVNGNDLIGTKLLALDRVVKTSGAPDCFIIGSSMVFSGIDPDSIDTAYTNATHQPLSCFNFGLLGVSALGTSKIARILVQTYHPRVLIYGASFRDLTYLGDILNIPWVNYRLYGQPLEGWLEDHSYAYRYATSYRLVFTQGLNNDNLLVMRINAAKPNGQGANTNVMDISTIHLEDFQDYVRWSRTYQTDPALLASLNDILSYESSGTQVIIVEMPAAPGVYQALPNGEQTDQTFTRDVHAAADAYGASFVATRGSVSIPTDGWSDIFHMNGTGARVFGTWLGNRLAEIIHSGQPPAHSP